MRIASNVLALAGCLALCATPVRPDSIALYEESWGGTCAKASVPVLNTVYVFHENTTGATMSSWRIQNDTGMTGLGSTCGQLSIAGDVFTGITVNYGACVTGTFLICTVDFVKVTTGPVPDCYNLRVVEYPGESTPIVLDCGQNEVPAGGGYFTFDIAEKFDCDDCATASESSTWGRVKSLYR